MDGSGSLQRQTETCSDCIERGDVDLLGRVRPGRQGRVRHCAGCGPESGKQRGNGRAPRTRVDILAWYVSTERRES